MSVYPDGLDTDLEIPRVDSNVTEISGDSINAIRDAIFNVEQSLGISPQGNKTSLSERINVSIDSNGNLKSSALEFAGLISLPITNSQISPSAGISESKLNLSFTTSYLNSRINGTITDITSLEQSFNYLTSTSTSHFSGLTNRHDGYAIDLVTQIRNSTKVEEALNEINSAFITFENHANSIFAVVNSDSIDSINSDIADIQEEIISSRDKIHENCILKNKRGEQGKQGNLVNTIFASTIFKTASGSANDILQIMRPNVARVSGKTPNLGGLSSGSIDKLRIQAGGINRSALDVNFSSPSIIPTDNLDDVVDAINNEAHSNTNHYPISAYNVNGRLVIAHNNVGANYTISIESVSQSAHSQLGFEDIVDTTINCPELNHGANVGGYIIQDTSQLLFESHLLASPSNNISTISFPTLSEKLDLLGVTTEDETNVICNITNHSADSDANGTYYITGIGTSWFELNTNIPAGTFDFEISADSVAFKSSAYEKIYDIFVEADYDGYGKCIKSLRSNSLSIPGVSLKTLNENFPTSGTIQWQVTNDNSLVLLHNGLAGEPVSIPSGFRGQLQVFMPDNINSALIEVTGTTSASTKAITSYDFYGSDDRLYLSSVFYPESTDTLLYSVDKRKIGNDIFQDELDPKSSENELKDLRNNGIVRGFDVISNTNTTIKVRGGRAIVSGRILDVETQDVSIDSFNSDFRLLALDKNGVYKTFDADEAGYTEDELTADGYGDAREIATVVSFGTSSSILTGEFVDRRIFINKIDGRLLETESRLDNRIDQLESSVGGIMWGFTQTFTTDDASSYVADIRVSSNPGFRYLEEPGFLGTQTTRRYEFTDTNADGYTIFKSPGLTHINIMLQVEYSDESGSDPFGVSGNVTLQIGANILTGISNDTSSEYYATVKTIQTTYFPSNSVSEQYITSIPTSLFDNLDNNIMFDIVPRIKITGSTYIDGGGGGGSTPIVKFGKIRIITSSYSIAANVLGVDGENIALATNLGDVL